MKAVQGFKVLVAWVAVLGGLSACTLGSESETATSSSAKGTSSGALSSVNTSSGAPISSMGSSAGISSSIAISSSVLSSSSGAQLSSAVDGAPFVLACPKLSDEVTTTDKYTFKCTIQSKLNVDQDIILRREAMVLPQDWTQSFCFGDYCFPTWIDAADAQNLPAGVTMPVDIYVNPTDVNGTASFKMVALDAKDTTKRAQVSLSVVKK